VIRAQPQAKLRSYLRNNKRKMLGEWFKCSHLPTKFQVLSSNPGAAKKRKEGGVKRTTALGLVWGGSSPRGPGRGHLSRENHETLGHRSWASGGRGILITQPTETTVCGSGPTGRHLAALKPGFRSCGPRPCL
jgi:hypothetical protein